MSSRFPLHSELAVLEGKEKESSWISWFSYDPSNQAPSHSRTSSAPLPSPSLRNLLIGSHNPGLASLSRSGSPRVASHTNHKLHIPHLPGNTASIHSPNTRPRTVTLLIAQWPDRSPLLVPHTRQIRRPCPNGLTRGKCRVHILSGYNPPERTRSLVEVHYLRPSFPLNTLNPRFLRST